MTKIPDEFKKRLRNRLYGVLCEREKNREWKKFLDSIIIELMGAVTNDEDKTLYQTNCGIPGSDDDAGGGIFHVRTGRCA